MANPNPKQQYGDAKPKMSYVPLTALLHLADVMREGAMKYGAHNWLKDPVNLTTYADAIARHNMLLQSGEDVDPETMRHHAAYIMACGAIILDALEAGTLIDDRVHSQAVGELMRALSRPVAPTGPLTGVAHSEPADSRAGNVSADAPDPYADPEHDEDIKTLGELLRPRHPSDATRYTAPIGPKLNEAPANLRALPSEYTDRKGVPNKEDFAGPDLAAIQRELDEELNAKRA